jgi:hypothetical protein
MENQTRFDLNAAVENWRNELAAQPNLASDDRRELETHLRDAIAGFQQRGLNDEESFWLARKRVGQPPQLGNEFSKANPVRWHYNATIKNHTVRFSAIVGLLVGVIVFAGGFFLPPNLFLCRAIIAMQSPLIPIVNWMQPASQPWGSNNDIYKLWAVILCYWSLLGLLLGIFVGLGCRLFLGWKGKNAD